MLLVVDVGNTQTHFGTFRGSELVEHWRFATVRDETADELAGKLAGMLALRGVAFPDLDSAIVSSTVPALSIEWGEIGRDRKSTRLNSSHTVISYAVFCLKKKN